MLSSEISELVYTLRERPSQSRQGGNNLSEIFGQLLANHNDNSSNENQVK